MKYTPFFSLQQESASMLQQTFCHGCDHNQEQVGVDITWACKSLSFVREGAHKYLRTFTLQNNETNYFSKIIRPQTTFDQK